VPNTYQTPGVYIEWLDRNAQQIVVGRTDVAGFVGLAGRGPIQTPIKIESYRQFVSTFGDVTEDAYLAYAVGGFFDNGGRTCWVVRVANPAGATPASSRLTIAGGTPFVVVATSPGAWGNSIEIEAIWDGDRIARLNAMAPGLPPRIIVRIPAAHNHLPIFSACPTVSCPTPPRQSFRSNLTRADPAS
jgi:phage tail sheath protein FI